MKWRSKTKFMWKYSHVKLAVPCLIFSPRLTNVSEKKLIELITNNQKCNSDSETHTNKQAKDQKKKNNNSLSYLNLLEILYFISRHALINSLLYSYTYKHSLLYVETLKISVLFL